MAATIRVLRDVNLEGGVHLYHGEIDLDASYPAGGYSIDPPGNTTLEVVLTDDHGGVATHWDRSAQKLICQWSSALASKMVEVTAGTNLATVTKIPFIALGV